MRRRRAWSAGLAVAATFAGLLFLAIGALVRSRPPTTFDLLVQEWVLGHQSPLANRIFTWITVLGGITAMRVYAAVGAAMLLTRRRWSAAAGVVMVPLLAVPIFDALKAAYGRPRPLGLGTGAESDAAFPSGHALTAAAVCGAIAYALWRGGILRRGPALALALLPPLVVGLSRIVLNVHWATDVIGGWCAGVVIAACFAAAHDRFSRSPSPASPSSRSPD